MTIMAGSFRAPRFNGSFGPCHPHPPHGCSSATVSGFGGRGKSIVDDWRHYRPGLQDEEKALWAIGGIIWIAGTRIDGPADCLTACMIARRQSRPCKEIIFIGRGLGFEAARLSLPLPAIVITLISSQEGPRQNICRKQSPVCLCLPPLFHFLLSDESLKTVSGIKHPPSR